MAKTKAKPQKTNAGNLTKFWFVWNIIESVILFTGGVLSILGGVLGNNDGTGNATIENVVAYVVSAFIILDGLLRIVMHLARYSKEQDDATPMVIAGFEISLGILFLLLQGKYGSFTYTVINLVSIILMVIGALLLVYAIFFIARKLSKLAMPLLEILFSAVLIGVGVTIEVLYNNESAKERLVLIMIGSILVVAAIAMLVITIITNKKANKEAIAKQEAEAHKAEVEVLPAESPKLPRSSSKQAVVPVDENEDETPLIEAQDE